MTDEPSLWQPRRPFERALVVVAHPDDAEFGTAATVAAWVDAGTEVHYLVLTDGASGSPDPTMTRERLVPLREQEQRAACAVLGVSQTTFLGHPDGYLTADPATRRQVAAAIRRHRPEVVVTMDPTMRWSTLPAVGDTPAWSYINHPDHRATGDLVLNCINPAASSRLWDTTLLDEGLEPWDVAEVWLMTFAAGDTLVDVGATFERKLEALRCHASQLGDWDPDPMLRERAVWAGELVGVDLAEAYRVLRVSDGPEVL